jgi:pantetheine-phosphate adenylyltransferase/dephospho-CoA kinase
MVIGITGGSGTGKSDIANLLGGTVIDVDKVYHGLLENNDNLRHELLTAFGTCERRELAGIVFNDESKLHILNGIASKYMADAVRGRLASAVGDVVIDAAVLFETGLDGDCDVTAAVLARQDVRVSRIMARDNLTLEQAKERIKAQKSDDYYAKSADIVIHNNGDLLHAVEVLKERLAARLGGANRTAIYGGTFDPPTLGHLDVIKRAAVMYEKLYVVVLVNEAKIPIFTPAQRVEMLEAITRDIPNVTVESFNGLLAEYAYNKKARYSVRGVRNGFDADYERPMFEFNAQIAKLEFGFVLDTIFIPTTRDHADTSSGNVNRLLAGGVFKVAARYLDKRIAERVIERFRPPRLT